MASMNPYPGVSGGFGAGLGSLNANTKMDAADPFNGLAQRGGFI